MAACRSCGEKNPPRAKFCLNCGAPLAGGIRHDRHRVRKTVTIVFSDLVGSTAMGERLDPETFLKVMERYYGEMRSIVEAHGGMVGKFIGDAVMAVFGVPLLREDDALRAVRAAVEMRSGIARLNTELRRDWGVELHTRTGVNTGEAVTGDEALGDALVMGDTTNTAARLEQHAGTGEILIGESTYRLVRDSVETEAVQPLELKGKSDTVPAYRVVSIKEQATGAAWADDSPFLARRMELALLEVVFEQAVSERACHQVTIVGSAGVGKTRLAQEFVKRARRKANVFFGRCLPYAEGATYWPVLDVVKAAAGISGDDPIEKALGALDELLSGLDASARVASDLAHLLGLSDEPVPAEELQWAVRKAFEALGRDRPVVIVFEDVHWAEQTFLDLVEHVTRWSQQVPILMLCLARSELLDQRPAWASERKRSTPLVLEPLGPQTCEELVEQLAPGLGGSLRRRLAIAAGGIPLFVKSMLSMLADDGVIRETEDGWETVGEVADITMPPTIHALISARLERLSPPEQLAIERAALIGEEFHFNELTELSASREREKLADVLRALVRKDFVRPGDWEGFYRFSHMMIRDIAYGSMPKEDRSRLHERFARWVQQVSGERAREYEEIIAYHMEQAYRLRTELRPVDARARELAAGAGALLTQAGRRAFARDDTHAAVNLLTRALDLLPSDDPERLLLTADLVHSMWDAGMVERARALADDGVRQAEVMGAKAAELRLRIRRDEMLLNVDPATRLEDVLARAEQAVRGLEELEDEDGLALAEYWAATLHFWLGRAAIAVEGLDRAWSHATEDGSLAARIVIFRAAAQIWGPTPATEIERWAAGVLKASPSPMVEAAALIARAYASALNGEALKARQLANRARSIYADMGLVVLLARTATILSGIELLVGDVTAAERELRRAYDLLDEMHETGFLSTVASLLAEVVCEMGRYEDAEALARRALDLANPDDADAQTRGKAVLAVTMALSGHASEAASLAHQALAVSGGTDLIMIRADALRHHARVLQAAGHHGEAAGALEQALSLYEQKGNTVIAARVRESLKRPQKKTI
ncbi:MAG: adenylate/guanylate cyclase domain-containing protein [Actinomycetota bacterium]